MLSVQVRPLDPFVGAETLASPRRNECIFKDLAAGRNFFTEPTTNGRASAQNVRSLKAPPISGDVNSGEPRGVKSETGDRAHSPGLNFEMKKYLGWIILIFCCIGIPFTGLADRHRE